MSQSYRIKSGDTLSALARRFRVDEQALAQANNIRDPNKIVAGRTLTIPDGFDRETAPRSTRGNDSDRMETPAKQTRTRPDEGSRIQGNQTWADPDRRGKTYPSRDGVPLYDQGDADWESQRLAGTGNADSARSSGTIERAGCAISACAMAVSALSGRTITPRQMDNYLDRNGGYDAHSNVLFDKTGGAAGTDIRAHRQPRGQFSVSELDRQLEQGRPVAIGVDYRQGGARGPGTDHWLTVTSRNPDGTYNANDPNGGKPITLRMKDGQLRGLEPRSNGNNYRFTGDAVTFTGGTPLRRGTPPTQAGSTGAPERTEGTRPARNGGHATGGNAILNELQTTGASARTASQDRVQPGVEGSRRMAENDRRKLEPYRDVFRAVAQRYDLPPALLAAIASRESRGGSALNPNGLGDNGNGFGLMQVDKNYHRPAHGPHSREHIAQAANILADFRVRMREMHPQWSEAEVLRGAVAAYNTGADVAPTADQMDRGNGTRRNNGTTGKDYSADVWARAQYYAEHGF